MSRDVFTQVHAIHTLLTPSRPPVVCGGQPHPVWRLTARFPLLLDIALLLTTAATYALATLRVPDLTVGLVAAAVVLLFVARLIAYRVEYLRLTNAADPQAHAAFVERSAREAHVAQQLQAFDLKALEYVLAEYDAQLEAVDRFANTLLGPARVGGGVGLVALLLGAYAGAQKVAGAWALPLLALPFGLALGGFAGVGSLDGRRRARALLARATALKQP
ncbi:hypothetical protein [Deinococcus aestuarii]|uniref:hypothetical protein n=1 Tax=Deinococcus aestuarii TaxID=2774531 RepID=UPI001FE92392|nr:hypothetical protein [Deinococcus aestuarii]